MSDRLLSVFTRKTACNCGSTSFLFVALFMLLLAFFIVLVALANFEQKKARTVVESVRTAFQEQNFLASEPVELPIKDTARAEETFDEKVRKIFQQTFMVVQLEELKQANALRLSVPVTEVFEPGTAALLETQQELSAKIVQSMLNEKPGEHHFMEIYLPSKSLSENQRSAQTRAPLGGPPVESSQSSQQTSQQASQAPQSLSMAQAGELARTFLNYGLPKTRLGVGLKGQRGDQKTLDFYFYTFSADRPKLTFEEAEAAAAAAASSPDS